MNIEISDKYLWINVGCEAETRKLEFFCDGKKFYEMDVKLTADGPDFFFSMDVSGYIGRTVEVRLADTGKEPEQDTAVESQESVMESQSLLQASLRLHSDKPGTNYKDRPEIHYTAPAAIVADGGRTIIIIDHGIIEYISEDGLKYKAVEAEEDILDKSFKLRSESGEIIVYMM